MKRPLFWALIFFILGIYAGRYLEGAVAVGLFVLLVTILAILFSVYTKWYGSLFFIIFALFGFINIQTEVMPKDYNLEYFADNSIKLEMTGEVLEISTTSAGRQVANVGLHSYVYNEKEYKTNANIKATLDENVFVSVGQKIGLYGELEKFSEKRVPGGFNEFNYYKSRKLDYKTYPDITYLGEVNKGLNVFMENLRNEFSHVYDICLPEREANIAKSMIIGDKSGLDEEIEELYKEAGIYHILAISGLHITIIAMSFGWFLNKFPIKRFAGMITIMFLLFYCIFTGMGVATVRSTIMCTVVIIGAMMHRERDLVTSISFAALCLLIYQPLYLWDVGFQYSFIAVYGLAVGSPAFENFLSLISNGSKKREKILYSKPIKEYFGGSLIATLFTLPIVIHNFFFLYPYSVLVNMLVIPSLCITTVSGFLIGILGLFFIEGAVFLSGIFYYIVKFYEYLCMFFVSMPKSEILTGSISYIIIGLIWVVLGFFVFSLGKKGIYFQKRKKYAYSSLAIFFIIMTVWNIYPRNYTTTFLDVGQGDSIVVTNREHSYVIDGGGWATTEIGRNTGVKVLMPYLEYCGIKSVEGAFVSHMDSDHVTGIIELVENYQVENLYISDIEYSEDDENYKLLMSAVEKTETNVIPISSGDVLEGENIKFECIYPPTEAAGTDRTNYSNVLKMAIGEIDFLFTGDIEYSMEMEILESGIYINAEILKLAHHGSKTSSDKDFLMAVDPIVAVSSTGVNNNFGHPSPKVVRRVESLGVKHYNTAIHGTIRIKTDGEEIKISQMLGG